MKNDSHFLPMALLLCVSLSLLASCAATDKNAEIAKVHGTGTITYEIVPIETPDGFDPRHTYVKSVKISETPDNDNGTIAYEVLLSEKTNPRRSYVVNTVVVGTELSDLRDYLSKQPKGTAVFRSDCKLMRETQEKIETVFYEEGFPLKEVWVPRSAVGIGVYTTDGAGRFRTRVHKTIYCP